MSKEWRATVTITLSQVKEQFECANVKYSAKKLQQIEEALDGTNPDLLEQLEGKWLEFLGEFIAEELGE